MQQEGHAAIDYAHYVGTGVMIGVPCWNIYVPCEAGRSAENWPTDYTFDNLPCGWFQGMTADAPASTQYAGTRDDYTTSRFPWCSEDEDHDSRNNFLGMKGMPSDVHPGAEADLNMLCGTGMWVAPGGVLSELYPRARGDIKENGASLMPWTTEWEVNVTTTTRTCPTFASAFGQAFGYAGQVEILITLILIFVFKKVGVIRFADGMVDMGEAGAHGIIDTNKLTSSKKDVQQNV